MIIIFIFILLIIINKKKYSLSIGNTFFTCGDDKLIKHWALQPHTIDRIVEDNSDNSCNIHPINTIASMTTLTSIDHHRVDHQFATSGKFICVIE
jgi:hypothetical protein